MVTATNIYSDITGTTLNFSNFDTLQGGTSNNTFNVSVAFAGLLYGGGGTGNDVFNLNAGGSVTGTHGINGQSGYSTINYDYPTAVTVTVTGFHGIGYSRTTNGFTGINTVNALTGEHAHR